MRNLELAVGFFTVIADTNNFKSYRDYEGAFGGLSFSFRHANFSLMTGAESKIK